jgi:hypothetical protein
MEIMQLTALEYDNVFSFLIGLQTDVTLSITFNLIAERFAFQYSFHLSDTITNDKIGVEFLQSVEGQDDCQKDYDKIEL